MSSTLYTIEFRDSSIGAANNLLRQAAAPGTIPLTASQAGRLGYQATGPRDAVSLAELLLRDRGERVYVTPVRSR